MAGGRVTVMAGTGARRPTGRTGLTAAAVIAVIAALVLPVAAACGPPDADDGRPAAAPVPAAVTVGLREADRATEAARSARVRSATRIGSTISLTADGVLGWTGGVTGTLTLTLTYTGGTLADGMRQPGSASMEARCLPDAYYPRMGDAFAASAGGRHWVRYAYDDPEEPAGG
ncbi:hypothetical protein NGM37_47255, partial [Streptomyces sp. TRM76130]|nr:hypothetical protein [Streptomyces sp. TRM76130]